jgi:hypothetical protein
LDRDKRRISRVVNNSGLSDGFDNKRSSPKLTIHVRAHSSDAMQSRQATYQRPKPGNSEFSMVTTGRRMRIVIQSRRRVAYTRIGVVLHRFMSHFGPSPDWQ